MFLKKCFILHTILNSFQLTMHNFATQQPLRSSIRQHFHMKLQNFSTAITFSGQNHWRFYNSHNFPQSFHKSLFLMYFSCNLVQQWTNIRQDFVPTILLHCFTIVLTIEDWNHLPAHILENLPHCSTAFRKKLSKAISEGQISI